MGRVEPWGRGDVAVVEEGGRRGRTKESQTRNLE